MKPTVLSPIPQMQFQYTSRNGYDYTLGTAQYLKVRDYTHPLPFSVAMSAAADP